VDEFHRWAGSVHEDFDAFLAAKSRILAALSRQIAQGIKVAHGGK